MGSLIIMHVLQIILVISQVKCQTLQSAVIVSKDNEKVQVQEVYFGYLSCDMKQGSANASSQTCEQLKQENEELKKNLGKCREADEKFTGSFIFEFIHFSD